jgi:hypothetical protein
MELFSNPALGLAWIYTAATVVAKVNQGDLMFIVRGVK